MTRLRRVPVALHLRLVSLAPARCDVVAAVAILVFTAAKTALVLANPLDLSADEAHYWEWSRRLDWAYYSKGPVVALLIAASTALLGDTDLAVRLPALLLSAILYGATYLLLRCVAGAGVALVGLALLASGLFFGTLGLGMTTDAPVLVCWLLGLWAAYAAVEEERPALWGVAGAAFGLATLAKYTAAIVMPSCVLVLLACADARTRRAHLRSRWLWVGAGLFVLALVQLGAWNLAHGGVNLAHNLGHVVDQGGLAFRPQFVLELLGSQLGLVGPILLPLLGWLGWQGWRRLRREGDLGAGILVAAALPLLALCLVVATTKPVYANWPMPAYLSGFVLLAHLAARDVTLRRRLPFPAGAALIVNGVVLAVGYLVLVAAAFGVTFGLSPDQIALRKLAGWKRLGHEVERLLDAEDARGEPVSFVIATGYGPASSIAFYAPSHPRVLCANLGRHRMNQYDVWGGWAEERDRDALLVLDGPRVPRPIARHFTAVEPVGSPLSIEYAGAEVRRFHFFVGRGWDGSTPPPPGRF